MKRERAKLLGSILALLVAGAAVWRSLHEGAPSLPSAIHRDVGRTLAAEAGKLLRPGGRVVVIYRDTESFPQPAFDFALAALKGALKEAGLPAPITRAIQLDPLRPLQVPPGDFLELIRKAGVADVIISLMGPPFLSDEQRASIGTVKPRMVAFWPGTIAEYANLKPLFEQHLLSAAIIHRPEALGLAGPARTGNSMPSPERFDALYQVVSGNGIPSVPIPGLP